MDDMTPRDMPGPDDLMALMRALGFGGPEVDPAEVRAHELAHFTDDLGMDVETAVRLLDIADSAEYAVRPDTVPTDEHELSEYIVKQSLAGGLNAQVKHTFEVIHHAEQAGVPLDAVMDDPEIIRRQYRAFLLAWDRCVADAVTVTVPDDISSLLGD